MGKNSPKQTTKYLSAAQHLGYAQSTDRTVFNAKPSPNASVAVQKDLIVHYGHVLSELMRSSETVSAPVFIYIQVPPSSGYGQRFSWAKGNASAAGPALTFVNCNQVVPALVATYSEQVDICSRLVFY